MVIRRSLSLALGVALLLTAPTIKGQPRNKDGKTPQQLFEDAEAYYKVREFAVALEGYKGAYLLSREPALLFNMAQCYRQLGQYAEALSTYRIYLRDVPDTPLRADIERIIKEVEELIAKKKDVSEATPVDPIKAPPGEKDPPKDTNAKPVVEEPPEEPESSVIVAPPSGPDPKEAPSGNPGTPLYIGAASAAGLGLILGGLSLANASGAKRLQESATDSSEFSGKFQTAKTLALAADVLVVAALASGVTGYLLSSKKKKTELSVSVSTHHVALKLRF